MNPNAVHTHATLRTILAIAAILLLVAGSLAAAQFAGPANAQFASAAANAQLLLNQIAAKKPDAQATLGAAEQTIDGLLDFVAAFKENPARRLISLYVGMLLGLIVASVLRMDLFCAASDATACAAQGLKLALPGLTLDSEILKYWPVALTGLLIGLGSNPTHEVIKYIQESKKSQKVLNGPSVVTRTVTEVAAPPGPAGPDAVLSFTAGERERLRAVQPLKRTTRTLFLR